VPRHGDTDGEKLGLAATELLTEGEVVTLAATDAVTDEDAATLGEADAELDTHKHVYLHRGESGGAQQQRVGRQRWRLGRAERSTRSPFTHWSGCGGEHCWPQQIVPRHGDTDGEKLGLAGTELLTEGDAFGLAATDAVTLELVVADCDAVAEREMQMQVRSLGAPQETEQQICPLHGDAVGVTLSLAAIDAVTLADADDEAVGDAVTDEDAATLGEADAELDTHRHVYLHRERASTQQRRGRAAAAEAAATGAAAAGAGARSAARARFLLTGRAAAASTAGRSRLCRGTATPTEKSSGLRGRSC
jgi:hypothetical protein